jgi:hypothetical protein
MLNFRSTLVIGMALLLSIAVYGRAEAVPITGEITFGGTLDDTLNLATTTEVRFNNPVIVTAATGDIAGAGIGLGTNATFNDFQFSPFVANNPLWTVALGNFAFNLGSVIIDEQDANSLVLLGINSCKSIDTRSHLLRTASQRDQRTSGSDRWISEWTSGSRTVRP